MEAHEGLRHQEAQRCVEHLHARRVIRGNQRVISGNQRVISGNQRVISGDQRTCAITKRSASTRMLSPPAHMQAM